MSDDNVPVVRSKHIHNGITIENDELDRIRQVIAGDVWSEKGFEIAERNMSYEEAKETGLIQDRTEYDNARTEYRRTLAIQLPLKSREYISKEFLGEVDGIHQDMKETRDRIEDPEKRIKANTALSMTLKEKYEMAKDFNIVVTAKDRKFDEAVNIVFGILEEIERMRNTVEQDRQYFTDRNDNVIHNRYLSQDEFFYSYDKVMDLIAAYHDILNLPVPRRR